MRLSRWKTWCVLLAPFTLSACSSNSTPPAATPPIKVTVPTFTAPKNIKLSSPAFKDGGVMPKQYTCNGAGISPPLTWSNVPPKAKSLVLVCTDPDAPGGTFTHWGIYNLSPKTKSLPENIPPQAKLPNGAMQLPNDFTQIGYGGPCPPSGTHRYVFTLYALKEKVDMTNVTASNIPFMLQGNVLAQGQLTAKYKQS